MKEAAYIDSKGNVIFYPTIVFTDCGAPGNKYTALCNDCEDSN